MSENKVSIIGAGITGIFTALYLKKAGYQVSLFDKSDGMDNCSYGNAGMIVPSHVIPLASPGMISKGLRWMLKRDSPFYIRPRLDTDLIKWGLAFRKNSTQEHVERAGAVLHHLLTRAAISTANLTKRPISILDLQRKGSISSVTAKRGWIVRSEMPNRQIGSVSAQRF